MSTFDVLTDAPGMLRNESLSITMKFERTGATTGRISWNIPTPAAGCTADTQAYCGMVVVIDTRPADSSKIPSNGTVYNADPTMDPLLFLGDKLGTAYVVGAFYQDRKTNHVDVDGLKPDTPYFVSGYPTDCQMRYLAEGVHAYSQDYTNRGHAGTNGKQVIKIGSGITADDVTGLERGKTYCMEIQIGNRPAPLTPVKSIDCVPVVDKYQVCVEGTDSLTYGDLVNQLNKQFATLGGCLQGPYAPNSGGFYWDEKTKTIMQWDGEKAKPVDAITSPTRPNDIKPGDYWYNPATGEISVWVGDKWVTSPIISSPIDPAVPQVGKSYWFDGKVLFKWNGTVWIELVTIISDSDPATAPTIAPGTYWFKRSAFEFSSWSETDKEWKSQNEILSTFDPNEFKNGYHWFNSKSSKLLIREAGGWVQANNVHIGDSEPAFPGPLKYWYNPTKVELQQRDIHDTLWELKEVASNPIDPTLRKSGDMWYQLDADEHKVWNITKKVWATIDSKMVIVAEADPSAIPTIADGSAWYQPSSGKMQVLDGDCWREVNYVKAVGDPSEQLPIGTIWINPTTGEIKVNTLDGWVTIKPIESKDDPTKLPPGTLWIDPECKSLMVWNGVSWTAVTYAPTSLAPMKGQCWFNTQTRQLLEWNGTQWIKGTPKAVVEIDCNGNLTFTDTTEGGLSYIGIKDECLIQSLKPDAILTDPQPGTDGASDVPSYNQLGVGTDGNDAIRSQLSNEIRYELGYPVITVELTQEQISHAIDKALYVLRGQTGVAYRRGFFFMQIQPEQQRYYLTNKIQGMHKIVNVLGVYRMTSSVMSAAHGAGLYGQAIAQHMYNMGSFDMLSFHIMSSYTSLMEQLFATRITFNWNEQTRELHMYHRFGYKERTVTVEAAVERTEQDIMSDRYIRSWILKYAVATCRLMLAEIRGKFSALPSANGTVSLNADQLRAAGETAIQECMADIEDYVLDAPDQYGMGSTFIFG